MKYYKLSEDELKSLIRDRNRLTDFLNERCIVGYVYENFEELITDEYDVTDSDLKQYTQVSDNTEIDR